MVDLDLHTSRPSVYLDQRIWIDLARAEAGKPRHPGDPTALAALRDAAAAGVAFPLSRVHYFETAKIKKPDQRQNLAGVMGSISYFRTLRGGHHLMRHQVLNAMHETFRRPTFRPQTPDPLGLGVVFAFTGEQKLMTVRQRDTGQETTEEELPGVGALRRRFAQLGETMLIAGRPMTKSPRCASTATSRRRQKPWQPAASRGRRPMRGMLRDDQVSARELPVRVTARELCHEYPDLFNQLLADHGLSLDRALRLNGTRSDSTRATMMEFSNRIPTMRLAADMKTALFRNAERVWQLNDLYDIDALSLAMPYCHVVMTDKDAADRVRRTKGDERTGTTVLSSYDALLEQLPDLVARAQDLGGDPTGWDVTGPGEGFVTSLRDGSWPARNTRDR